MDAERQCNSCAVTKPIDEFYKNTGCVGGYEPRCKDCRKAGVKGARKSREKGAKSKRTTVVELEPPAFLRVETQEIYSIASAADTEILLSRDEIESLWQWWKVKRKVA